MTPAAAMVLAVAFAFANQDGSRLLTTGELAAPEVLRTGMCAGGQRVNVQFEGRQAEGKASTGRQTPGNFANTAGTVFRVVGGKVSAGTTCLLADESFFTGATVVPLKRPGQSTRCSKDEYPQF